MPDGPIHRVKKVVVRDPDTDEKLGAYEYCRTHEQPFAHCEAYDGDGDEEGPIIDTFVEELGATVRSCLDCGALVGGGPTRCGRCVEDG